MAVFVSVFPWTASTVPRISPTLPDPEIDLGSRNRWRLQTHMRNRTLIQVNSRFETPIGIGILTEVVCFAFETEVNYGRGTEG